MYPRLGTPGLALVPDLSNYAVFIAIHDASHGFGSTITAYSYTDKQWRRQNISEGGANFRHNRVTSQINFRGSDEGTTILGGFGGMPPGKICKIPPKNRHFCAFWKQVLVQCFYETY